MNELTLELTLFFSQFHFLRPAWLLLMIPALAWFLMQKRRRQMTGQWQQLVDPELQEAVIEQQVGKQDKFSQLTVFLALIISSLALAGPTWKRLPQPVVKNEDALIILQDMSYSMAAEDVSPSRAERALQKITDILKTRTDGQTALVSYAGEAYTVTPLTSDQKTILNLLPSLSPFIMPAPGSRPDRAIELAQQLASNAGVANATLLLITDGIRALDIDRIDEALDESRFKLRIITLGTSEGAPIPLPTGGFLKDNQGNLIVPGLDTGPIEKLSQQMGVPWRPISLLDNDWQALLDQRPIGPNQSQTGNPDDAPEILFDQWKDQGHWLMLLLLPLALMSFRRGWLFSLVLAVPLLNPQPAAALDLQQGWRSLWQTPDQQAAELLQQDPQQAAQTFEDPGWKGSAAYQAGDYEQAAKAFAKDQSPNAQYNRGNALAQAGKLEQALEAYDQALAANPDNQDAIYNRKLVEEALKQKQQQEQSENQNQQGDQQQNQDGEQSDSQNSQGDNSQNQNNQSQQGSDSSQDQQDSRDKKQQDPKNKDGQDAQNSEQSKADEQNSDQSEDERQQASQARKEDGDGESDSNQPPENATAMENPLEDMDASEQMQLKQWLNRVPDQPGKLLQRKFLYQYSKQADQNEPEQQVW